jgi:hypothetical protein
VGLRLTNVARGQGSAEVNESQQTADFGPSPSLHLPFEDARLRLVAGTTSGAASAATATNAAMQFFMAPLLLCDVPK